MVSRWSSSRLEYRGLSTEHWPQVRMSRVSPAQEEEGGEEDGEARGENVMVQLLPAEEEEDGEEDGEARG